MDLMEKTCEACIASWAVQLIVRSEMYETTFLRATGPNRRLSEPSIAAGPEDLMRIQFVAEAASLEKAKCRVAKCKQATRKAAYPSSPPITEPATTSLRKCIPDTTREIATFAAKKISTGII